MNKILTVFLLIFLFSCKSKDDFYEKYEFYGSYTNGNVMGFEMVNSETDETVYLSYSPASNTLYREKNKKTYDLREFVKYLQDLLISEGGYRQQDFTVKYYKQMVIELSEKIKSQDDPKNYDLLLFKTLLSIEDQKYRESYHLLSDGNEPFPH